MAPYHGCAILDLVKAPPRAAFVAFAIRLLLPAAPENSANESSILHVTVVDVATGAERKDQAVSIRGNRIISVAATRETDAAAPGAIDAYCAYLIPGVGDMHIHVHDP